MKELLLVNERKHTFTIKGVVQGEAVSGEFTAHYPSLKDEIRIQSALSQLISGADLEYFPARVYDFAYSIAYLSVVLDETPEWFVIDKIDDQQVIIDVYKEVVDFINSFRRKDEDRGTEGTGSQAEDSEAVEGK